MNVQPSALRLTRLRTPCALLAFVLASAAAPRAHAADKKKGCVDAYTEAQTLRDAHKLIEAREKLTECSQATCKAFIVKDCTAWLTDTESRIPSVVLSAHDAQGAVLSDVAVTVDGAPFRQKLDGESAEVDPGSHTFSFVASDGTEVKQAAVVLEGQKAQPVAVTIPTAASLAAQKKASDDAAAAKDAERASADKSAADHSAAEKSTSGIRVAGLAIAGVGVAGIIVGSAFGLTAISKNNDSNANGHCDNTGCDPTGTSLRNTALNDATVSTVAFVAGGVLAAGGVTLALIAPSIGKRSGRLDVTPWLDARGSGLSIRGAW